MVQHGDFREGPLEVGIADFRARGPKACAGRLLGTFDQAVVGDKSRAGYIGCSDSGFGSATRGISA